jgi:hypothetical protein
LEALCLPAINAAFNPESRTFEMETAIVTNALPWVWQALLERANATLQ